MRSAQIPFGTWAIMKKFIYCVMSSSRSLFPSDEYIIAIKYEQNMNTI